MNNQSNSWVANHLNEFLGVCPKDYQYVVIGSVALISYTQKINYFRQIHDIDVICQAEGFTRIANELLNIGYEQSTFINKSMPFYKALMRLVNSKYYRFEKEGRALELMTTEFKKSQGSVCIELYPGLRFWFPESFVTTTNLNGVSFRAASPEALYCIYSVGFTTWGKVVRAKNSQVLEDLKNLKKVVDMKLLRETASKVRIEVGKLSFKLPLMLIG